MTEPTPMTLKEFRKIEAIMKLSDRRRIALALGEYEKLLKAQELAAFDGRVLTDRHPMFEEKP